MPLQPYRDTATKEDTNSVPDRSRTVLDFNAKLIKFRELVSSLSVAAPSDFSSLYHYLIYQEMKIESEKLVGLKDAAEVSFDAFKEAFKTLCLHRALRNQGTALDFSGLPKGDVNILYWELAILLFSPSDLEQMFAIVSPHTRLLIEGNIELASDSLLHKSPSQSERREHLKKASMVSQETPISTLAGVSIPQDFSEYIFEGEEVLCVRDINHFTFERHMEFYLSLLEEYPDLHKRLYAHNQTLETLAGEILLYKERGKTPRVALQSLARGLELGGEKMTGQTLAGHSAIIACGIFNEYVDTLPENMPLQQNLWVEGGSLSLPSW